MPNCGYSDSTTKHARPAHVQPFCGGQYADTYIKALSLHSHLSLHFSNTVAAEKTPLSRGYSYWF